MENEIWLPVPGWSNYEVSDLGNVRNIKFNRVLKQYSDGHYLQTSYSQNKNWTVKRVHIVVANVFIPNPNSKPFVNHINGIKTDNRKVNLEWSTAKENSNHSNKLGLRKYNRKKLVEFIMLKMVNNLVPFYATAKTPIP